ncbi:MAG: hypothetical protein ACKON9_04730 [Planctomycetaceae bacterium]
MTLSVPEATKSGVSLTGIIPQPWDDRQYKGLRKSGGMRIAVRVPFLATDPGKGRFFATDEHGLRRIIAGAGLEPAMDNHGR